MEGKGNVLSFMNLVCCFTMLVVSPVGNAPVLVTNSNAGCNPTLFWDFVVGSIVLVRGSVGKFVIMLTVYYAICVFETIIRWINILKNKY